MAGRQCKVCAHPSRAEIEQAIIAGESRSSVAKRFGLSQSSVSRHFKRHLVPDLVAGGRRVRAAETAAITIPGRDIENEVVQAVRWVSLEATYRAAAAKLLKVVEACERELLDPAAPDRYFFGPRAHEIRVVYTYEDDDGRGCRGVETLQALLDRALGGGGMYPALVESKAADPRELILKALKQSVSGILVAAKLVGADDDAMKVNLGGSEEWRMVLQVIMEELAEVPEIRVRLAERLKSIASGNLRKTRMGTGPGGGVS